MSLISFVLRSATVKALRGVTFAEDRVHDSAIGPFDASHLSKPAPFIVVYTEEETTDVGGLELLGGQRSLSLVIQYAVASTVKLETGGHTIEIPSTDAGLEATLDLMRYDILKTLQQGASPWCVLWRRVVFGVKTLKTQRGASTDKGVRFAAHALLLNLNTLADPIPGEELPALWKEITDFLKEDPELEELSLGLRSRILL